MKGKAIKHAKDPGVSLMHAEVTTPAAAAATWQGHRRAQAAWQGVPQTGSAPRTHLPRQRLGAEAGRRAAVEDGQQLVHVLQARGLVQRDRHRARVQPAQVHAARDAGLQHGSRIADIDADGVKEGRAANRVPQLGRACAVSRCRSAAGARLAAGQPFLAMR